MRFPLTGHDLSYWDSAANGSVLPDGQHQVYVGDSSAMADLPLRAGFTVPRSFQVSVPAGKTVASVTLPQVGSRVGDNVTTMHIFAIATGTGTPTSS